MVTLPHVRDLIWRWDEAYADVGSRGFTEDEELLAGIGEELANALRELRELLDEPTNMQALALARLMRDRPNAQVVVHRDVFDLPNGYWLAIIGLDGFQCGIAPDGAVSS